MIRNTQNCIDSISAAGWDLDNAVMVLRGVARGKTPCKKPRAAILEYIGSATAALAEAKTTALKLPISNKDL